jgi:hypothetical protein
MARRVAKGIFTRNTCPRGWKYVRGHCRKGSFSKTSSKKYLKTCIPGTTHKVKGGGCQCRTHGGGPKFVKKHYCKR